MGAVHTMNMFHRGKQMNVCHKSSMILKVHMVLLLGEKVFPSVGAFSETYIIWWFRLTVPSV